jgi:tetratricopeptide (TPR) repeat protein
MKDDLTLPDRNRADALLRAGRRSEAIAIYRLLTENFPEEDSNLLALAWALHDSGRLEEAAGCFERLFEKELARKPFTGFAYDELVRIYRAGENQDALVNVCQRAAAAQPDDIGLLCTLGEAYLAAGKADSALGVFEKLIRLEPDAPENWCALGSTRLALGDPNGAEEAYIRAAKIEPADAPVFFGRLAEGCIRAGYPEWARAALEQGLTLNPHEPLHWIALAEVLTRLRNPDAAVEACTRAASLRPETTGSCWHRLGNLFAKEGLHPQATDAFAKAVLAEPESPRYLLRLAASYAARGLEEPAADALRRAEALIGGKTASTET